MGSSEQLDILRRGVQVWNEWRQTSSQRLIDLSCANLNGADLSGINLSHARLQLVKLRGANLARADLCGTDMVAADLCGADLGDAELRVTCLNEANVSDAKLVGADLQLAHLDDADLLRADLRHADLRRASFIWTILKGADLAGAKLMFTTFGGVDLRAVKGLASVIHVGPSIVDTITIHRSKGVIPLAFLRGVGLQEYMIQGLASLVKGDQGFHSCFISYSSRDEAFVERLYSDLQSRGVRCWVAPKHLGIGDRIRTGLDQSIRQQSRLLLILSEAAVHSDWVEQEVETALAREREEKIVILVPIRIDDVVMSIATGWPALVRHTRNIGDFRHWQDSASYKEALERLLSSLRREQARLEEYPPGD